MVNLGIYLKELTKQKGLKQQAVADSACVSRSALNRFFNGRSEIKASDVLRVLKVLGIDVEVQIRSGISVKQ